MDARTLPALCFKLAAQAVRFAPSHVRPFVAEDFRTTSRPNVLAIAVSLALGLCASGRAWSYAYIPPWKAADRAELERRAHSGDADSQVELADCYHDGAHGFRVNLKLAARWYLEAAKRGRPRAQATIGEMYEFGEGVPQDHQKALDWIRKGTVEWPQSAIGVAYRYEHGFKAPTDLPKAMEWYRISAEAGYVIAQTSLGELYERAPGLQNLDEAVRWYRAAANTWGPAMCNLGRLYEAGKGVTQDYAEAARWYRTAIDKAGAVCGEYGLGLLYEQGLGVPKDRNKAMELYHGVAAGNADAQRRLFSLYEVDLGLPADPDKAIEWYRANAQRGDRRAEVGLGLHYQYGKGVPTNLYVAYALYILAQQQVVGQDDLPKFTSPKDKGYWYGGTPTQALAEEMSIPGNLLTAIQHFIENPPDEPIED